MNLVYLIDATPDICITVARLKTQETVWTREKGFQMDSSFFGTPPDVYN